MQIGLHNIYIRIHLLCAYWKYGHHRTTFAVLKKEKPKNTGNSAVADKPRNAFVEIQWRGWPPKNTPSPYV